MVAAGDAAAIGGLREGKGRKEMDKEKMRKEIEFLARSTGVRGLVLEDELTIRTRLGLAEGRRMRKEEEELEEERD